MENPNIADTKSVIIEHPKTSHKLSKTVRQAEKVSQVSSGKRSLIALYIVIQKKVKIFCQNNIKM